MPAPLQQLLSGTIPVDVAKPVGERRVAPCALVSSHDQRAALDRQVAPLTGGPQTVGLEVGQVVVEVVRA
jgi:putative resolvase